MDQCSGFRGFSLTIASYSTGRLILTCEMALHHSSNVVAFESSLIEFWKETGGIASIKKLFGAGKAVELLPRPGIVGMQFDVLGIILPCLFRLSVGLVRHCQHMV